jgi:DNA replication and repair protein RecF
VHLGRLWLTDFRNYEQAELTLAPGLTALMGDNGEGKTNLLEAIDYLATLSSFRSAPRDALVRTGSDRAIVRAEVGEAGRTSLVEAELPVIGRDRILVNRQPLRRARDLLGTLRTTVFSPDDLALVKGGPGERRRLLDDALVACLPRHDATRGDLDRVLRQRSTLLKQAGGRLSPEIASTLEVWDTKLAELGDGWGRVRDDLVRQLAPVLARSYDDIAPRPADVRLTYDAPWREHGLAAALAAARHDDLRRGVCTVGPHRDDLVITVDGMPARTHASQGEQRSLALGLRVAVHLLVGEAAGASPVLLLDDVLSELDPARATALLGTLPPGQALLTTAGPLPEAARPDLVLRVRGGTITS